MDGEWWDYLEQCECVNCELWYAFWSLNGLVDDDILMLGSIFNDH